MPVETLPLAAAAQYTGAAGTGLFTFERYNGIARTTRIAILSIGYTEPAVPNAVTTNIRVFAVRPSDPTQRMLLGSGLAGFGLLDPVTGDGFLRLCGIILPREPDNNGAHWDVQVVSDSKANDGVLIIDYDACPSPDTNPSDSHR